MSDVSQVQGHAPLAKPSVKAAPAHYLHSSIPQLFSQFRGPFPINMAEMEEERKKREDEERKRQEDDEKRTNFDKVREKAEREETARKAAEAELEKLRKEKADREAADKAASDQKLKEQQEYAKLAEMKEAEAKAKAAEAEAEKKRADDLAAKVKAFEDAQEAELAELLKGIPEEKRPPLDQSDPVSKRLATVKYASSILAGPKPPVGAGVKKEPADTTGRKKTLLDAQKTRPLTEEESFELMGLGE